MSNSEKKTKIVQAAGHGLLRIDPERDGAIIKPTTRQECVSYECFFHDPQMKNFLQFLPKYFTSWPIPEDVYVPGSKFTHDVSLENLCRLSEAGNDGDQNNLFNWKGMLDINFKNNEDAEDQGPIITSWKLTDLSKTSSVTNTRLVYESSPSVLDLKIGRFRHTNSTPLRKYMRMWRKDGPTTSRSVGMRLCGVKHSRFVLNSLLKKISLSESDDDDDGEKSGDKSQKEENVTDAINDPVLNEKKALRREKRLAAIRKRHEKNVKAGESDSEIMQLPRAAAEAKKQQQQQQTKETSKHTADDNNRDSDVLIDILGWTEDKVLGRNATAEELVELLAMFCTIHVDEKAKIGRSPVCPEDKGAAQRFDPLPEKVLMEYFLKRINTFIEILEKDKILERYSFASTSILFLHRWVVREVVPVNNEEKTSNNSSSSTSSSSSFILELEADLRLVDFSSSGPLVEELKHLGTEFNPKLRTTELNKNNDHDHDDGENGDATSSSSSFASTPSGTPVSPIVISNPFATHQPQREMVKMYTDESIEFNFGLENAKASLENLISVCDILASRTKVAKQE